KLYLYGDNINNTDAIWVFDPGTNNWTWINGDSIQNGRSDHGIYQYADTGTYPRGMLTPNSWQLGEKVYVMYYRYSDAIWEYNCLSNQWRWIRGMYNATSKAYIKTPYLNHELNEPNGDNPIGASIYSISRSWQIGDTMYLYMGDSLKNTLWRYDLNTDVWA